MSGFAAGLPVLVLCAVLAACGQAPADPQQTAAAIAARIDAKDLAGADEMLRKAITRWPDDPELRQLQGDLDLERGYGVRAQAAYEKALIRAPINRVLKIRLGRALLLQDRWREALALAQSEPGDEPEIRARFGLVRLEAGIGLATEEAKAAGRALVDTGTWRGEAEALWREALSPPPGADMSTLRRRLEEAAQKWPPVEAGRRHAQCEPAREPARSAESDATAGERIRVGPGERLRTPAEAAAEAKDGAVVEIAAGDYDGDPVTWTQDNLTIRGRNGRPRLRLLGSATPDRAIWVLQGRRTVVENMEFAGAADGVALRLERGDLTVRGSAFRDNGTGIVATADDPGAEVLVTQSEFSGGATGVAAGSLVDIGAIGRLTLEFSFLHGVRPGAAVRSRAAVTRINYNRIAGEGRAGALIDAPDGGSVEIVGNELRNGPESPAPFISFGGVRRGSGEGNLLYVISNSFFNDTPGAAAINIGGMATGARAVVANNVFAGAPLPALDGNSNVRVAGNQAIGGAASLAAANFELTRDSPAIDSATDPRALDPAAPPVEFEYRHPTAGVARVDVWKPDAGAHEFCASGESSAPGRGLALPGG